MHRRDWRIDHCDDFSSHVCFVVHFSLSFIALEFCIVPSIVRYGAVISS